MDQAVTWGQSLANDLTAFKQGELVWSAIDRGALLYGPPGTGKTTFAKALAGSCGVPLVATSLGEWQAAGHLGDLLRAMRKTFEDARSAAPVILLIDEIDSFGDRSSFAGTNRDYSIQVINAFLEMLDGIHGREGVVIIGACNHPHRIDPAITRSGRLDRAIPISLPDQAGLAAILRHHLRRHGEDFPDGDLARIAGLAFGATGADCERWVRGARRRARQENRSLAISDLELEVRGVTRPQSAIQRRRSAVHEAGHSLILAINAPQTLLQATIRQTARTAGGVVFDPSNTAIDTAEEMTLMLAQFLAGRAAEEVLLGEVSAGAGGDGSSDLARATYLATTGLTALGLYSDEHLTWFGMPEIGDLGRWLTARPVLAEAVAALLAEAYGQAKRVIEHHRNVVVMIADLLEEKETLQGAEIIALLKRHGTKARKARRRTQIHNPEAGSGRSISEPAPPPELASSAGSPT